MAESVKPIPEGYHSVTPYLIVDDGARALEFYRQAFGATEVMRMAGDGGKVSHAEIRIGDSMVMLADEHPDVGARRSEEHTSELQSLMRISYAVFCLTTKKLRLQCT